MISGQYILLMCFGYIITIAIETLVLLVGLSSRHSTKHRLLAGAWLTACTYPIVWLVFPVVIDPQKQRALYLWVAEIFAPAAECLLFYIAFEKPTPKGASPIVDQTGAEAVSAPIMVPVPREDLIRDMLTIIVANLASFGGGLLMERWGLWDMLM